jgi:hypothetical protein
VSKDALFSFCAAKRHVVKTFFALVILPMLTICFSCASCLEAADYRTPNFIIRNAPNNDLAKQFGDTAERLRKEMAILWLGEELPRWSAPCPIFVKVGNYGAGGETSMRFNHGEVFDWDMQIQGPVESILTAVLPHEITHMILASHFRQPSPRWFDEGAATSVENEKERKNYRQLLFQYLRTGRGIPFNPMFRLGEYPDDQMPLYAQGFSLAEFLIMQQGHRHYVDFASAGMKTENWPQAMKDYYGYDNLGELQNKWVNWVDAGCPDLNQIAHNQPIKVSETTQYIASRDFMPVNQPMILARATRPAIDVVPVAWEVSQPVQNTVASLQPEREPIRMALSQIPQNQTLVANAIPITELGNEAQKPANTTPRAVIVQTSPSTATETRLPSYFMENQPVPVTQNRDRMPDQTYLNQQTYQSSRNPQPPLPAVNDSRTIFEWRIR